jgi:hypothetical protein
MNMYILELTSAQGVLEELENNQDYMEEEV